MKTVFLIFLGGLCLILGAIGIFIPVFPTTPFVLLAAGCFGGSSPALYNWLAQTRYFGAYIRNYKTGAGVEKTIKLQSLLFLWGMLGISIVLVDPVWVKCLLVLIGAAVTAHILLLKTKKQN